MIKARRVLARRWPVVVIAVAVSLSVAWWTQPEVVEASERWSVSQVVAYDLSQSSGSPPALLQSALQITRGTMLATAADGLGRQEESEELAERVTATANPESLTIEITAIGDSPADATQIVEAFSAAFIEVSDRQESEKRQSSYDAAFTAVDNLEAELDRFVADHPEVLDPGADPTPLVLEQYRELDSAYRDSVAQVSRTERDVERGAVFVAESPGAPRRLAAAKPQVPDRGPRRWLLFGAAGLVVGLFGARLVERSSPRLDLDSEVTAELDLPVIAHIGSRPPGRPERLTLESEMAEEYRRVASVMRYLMTRDTEDGAPAASVFMVISADTAEGKSTTAAMASLCLAEAGVPTLAMGCDYRKPLLDVLLDVPRHPGIVERAVPSMDRPELDDIVKPADRDRLWVAPSGGPVVRPIGCNDVAADVIGHARVDGLAVVVDTAPLRVTGDAIDLLEVVDDVILVVRSGRTRVRSAREACEMVTSHGGTVRGAILTASRQAGSRSVRRYARDYESAGAAKAPTA